MNKLEGKWALVTGSSRGVGQQIALGLAKEGSNVIIHGRRAENLTRTIELLEPYNINTLAVTGKLGMLKKEEQIIDTIIKKIGFIDILYNNAAIMSTWYDSAFEIPMDEWKRVFEVNLYSMIRLCNAFIPIMVKRNWGRVINLSSGIKDTPQLTPYSVTKAAVDKYSRDISAELEKTNVLVNILDPGWLKTDLGGENAEYEVETVLPGALVPALLEDFGPSGNFYRAQDFRDTEG
jgi:NAD(P)-dependent dehydrogenase (short-subunit alcohol dehydrogenase family)